MDVTSFYTVIVTTITVFGSASAWRYYDKRASTKEKQENFMKDDCRERIEKLETFLKEASKEKDELREKILSLTSEVSELRVKVEIFQQEKNQLALKKQIRRRNYK